jgi:hypothetical protein
VNTAIALGKPWAFTDLHADLGYASYFSSLARLDEVDWNVMPLKQWGGNDDVKSKRQAEFLVHQNFPWSAVTSLGVKSAAVAAAVQPLLPGGAPPVVIQPDWYY